VNPQKQLGRIYNLDIFDGRCLEYISMGATIAVSECVMLVVKDLESSEGNTESAFSDWANSVGSILKMPLSYSHRSSTGEPDVKNCFAELLAANDEFRRKRLLLCGSDLADAVTSICLEALAIGYDVFLLTDLITISDHKYSVFHWERLFQAGAVPTTMTQMMGEWILSESNIQVVKEVKQLSDEFRRLQT
jgi:hypothetical protein